MPYMLNLDRETETTGQYEMNINLKLEATMKQQRYIEKEMEKNIKAAIRKTIAGSNRLSKFNIRERVEVLIRRKFF